MSDVIALGMATVDFIGLTPRLPQADEVFALDGFEVQGGGPAATAAVTLAKLGRRVAFAGVASQDLWGEVIAEDFARYGVDTRYLLRAAEGHPSRSIILVETASGKRSILYSKGSARQLTPGYVPAEAIAQTRVLHLDGFHLEAATAAARAARAAKVLVSLDGGAGELWPGIDRLLSLVDILVVARQFAYNLTGVNDPLEAGPMLACYGARHIVITDGANGAWYWGETHGHQPAFPVAVVDTTGAGDVFHGAYLHALLQRLPIAECVRYASATAALKCRQAGGRTGIPTGAEVDAFLERHGQ